MKALILNSGLGSRMGEETKTHPKCMTKITAKDTIVSRQLKQLYAMGVKEVVMTTGAFDEVLQSYCNSLNIPISITFIKNPVFKDTNYIYSIYCAKDYLDDDIVLMHGDLVFDNEVLLQVLINNNSCMTVSSTTELPEKDFKAVINNGSIEKIGIEFFDNALAAQPLYKLNKKDWSIWLDEIIKFCESDNRKCYAENAFNKVSDKCDIRALDVENKLCSEIDNLEDLERIKNILNNKNIGADNYAKKRR